MNKTIWNEIDNDNYEKLSSNIYRSSKQQSLGTCKNDCKRKTIGDYRGASECENKL